MEMKPESARDSLQKTVQNYKIKYYIKISTGHTKSFVRAFLFAEPRMFLSKRIWLVKLYPKISSGNRQE